MKVINVIIKKIKLYKQTNRKYEVSLMAATNSFYLIVTLFSLFFLFFQVYNFFSKEIENFIVTQVVKIFTEEYQNIIQSVLPILKFNGFSALIIINLIWSSSKIINVMNKTADKIYKEIKPRNSFLARINSFFMFAMLLTIIVFELLFIVYINKIMYHYLGASLYIIIRLLQKIIEFLLFYLLILLVYMHVVPIRMPAGKAYKGAFLATSGFYIISSILLIIIKLFFHEHFSYGVASSLTILFVWIYLVNEILIWGLIYNYYTNKLG